MTRAVGEVSGPVVGFREAFRFWLKLGFISFGGPTGQIAIMHSELVERRRWISESRFLHALNYCMLLPGPEAMQLATYVGWLLHRTAGGLVAGTCFVLPSVFILLGLSYVYVGYGTVPAVAAVFLGLKAAVLAIVISATVRIGRRALRHPFMYLIAAGAFVALFALRVPFPAVIAGAALVGLVGVRGWPHVFVAPAHGAAGGEMLPDGGPAPEHTRPSRARALRVVAISLALWLVPVAILAAWRGAGDVLFREAVFFSKAALVTFGGAYAVLPYVAQQAVETHGWLTAPQMIDGLGLAETTPGPLIMVLQFVGFLAGWNQATDLGLAGPVLGALIATYFTFMPCFAWIFLGAPYVEASRRNALLAGGLAAITAAVVGVVLNLAVWFGMQVITPGGGRIDWFALALGVGALVALQRFRWEIVSVAGAAGALGLLHWLAGTWLA
ncbi:MAG TPA: chromate efflux transporter [Candidatus Binatia bacterium]|nr:chromate efflux transporter [Candidatus Binatia bacterium]